MKKKPTSSQILSAKSAAFTLIELLTVIAIIGILAAILIPVVGHVRESARATLCASNIREWGMAIILFSEENDGHYQTHGSSAHPWHTTGYTGDTWASTNADYYSYMDVSGSNNIRKYRACASADVEHGNITYAMALPHLTDAQQAQRDHIPLGGAATPSNLLIFAETTSTNDGWVLERTAGSGMEKFGSRAIPEYDRHDGRINAVFADGHLQSIKMGSSSDQDPDSFASNFEQWLLIY